MNAMVLFVRGCAVYNFSGALSFVVPGVMAALGARGPGSSFWRAIFLLPRAVRRGHLDLLLGSAGPGAAQ